MKKCDVYVILPDRPRVFWRKALSELLSNGMKLGEMDVIYACSCQLREAALSALKLGYRDDIVVVGHNYGGVDPFFDIQINKVRCIGLDCSVSAICREVTAAVNNYIKNRTFPEKKITVLPSV